MRAAYLWRGTARLARSWALPSHTQAARGVLRSSGSPGVGCGVRRAAGAARSDPFAFLHDSAALATDLDVDVASDRLERRETEWEAEWESEGEEDHWVVDAWEEMGRKRKNARMGRYPHLGKTRTHWDLTVEDVDAGLTLRGFLEKRSRRPPEEVNRSFTEGTMVVQSRDGEERGSAPDLVLDRLDTITIDRPAPEEEFDAGTIPLHIIYEDDALVCLNKQPGVIVQPTGPSDLNNLLSALHCRYRNLEDPALDRVPHLAHRIDKYTSGVLLVAIDSKLKARLNKQFTERKVRKEYLAIVHGRWPTEVTLVDGPIKRREEGASRDIPLHSVHPGGKACQTEVEVVEAFPDFTFLKCRPRTGRTHQIRVHCAHIGHPIIGDLQYGGRDVSGADLGGSGDESMIERSALHAFRLTVVHPASRQEQTFEAPLHEDMEGVLEVLRSAQTEAVAGGGQMQAAAAAL